ncbi:uncharacterized protein B0H64DRAFT_329234 [Chaetomium fimeti]|uniref:Formylmethionine deformylase-like protein n=1 Tax=Chaetomium fimeti TaxID=1854472 RepID=A0AAE0LP69_9PEZI|nr:hypothetical protein B0H64DRAFT_329234 [Chaetomium fimeti]
MEQHSSARARPEHYEPYFQHQTDQVANGGWNPMAPTPDLDSPSPPPPRPGVSFAPVSPPPLRAPEETAAGPATPSSVGLGIGSPSHAAQYPGYHSISRDSLQQNSDSPPTTPPPVTDSSKFKITPHEYPIGSPNGSPPHYYYPQSHPYGGPPPPDDPGNSRLARLADSNGGKMIRGGWTMYALFFAGFAFAVGHHAFYDSLDGKPADDQIRMMRFGSLLSYAAKASLVAAVVFAYQQHAWVTVINNSLQLRSIDSLFSAVSEPQALLNWEFVKKARVAVCLAILAWLFPLTVILTPATLTVAPVTEAKEEQCFGVRTLNFDAEREKNWRKVDRLNGVRGVSLSLWNCTVANSVELVDTPFNETYFDYWTESSGQVELVVAQSALTGAVIPRDGVAFETCGGGWNCSYTISFKGPGYKCDELARGRKLDEDDLKRQGVPFNAGELAPNGDYGYMAEVNEGEYFSNQVDVVKEPAGGIPEMDPPYPEHFGAFRTEPLLWIGYSIHTGSGNPPENRTVPGWDTAFEAAVFRCEHYLVNYTVQFNHTYSQQTTTVIERDYLHPIVDTEFVPGETADDGTNDNTTAIPESNYILPSDLETYRETAAYHSIGKRMRSYLGGTVKYAPFALVESEAAKTRLIDTETYLPQPNLMTDVRDFYENMTLSLLSNPQFVIVSWAAKPHQRSGVTDPVGNPNDADPALAYPCTRTRVANAYVFNRRDLWIAYAVAIGAALFAVVLGSAALRQNNFHVRDAHVSSVVAATRAPCLEALPWKASKWGEVPREILDIKLGYGVVAEPGPNGTPAAMAVAMGGAGPGMWMGMGAGQHPEAGSPTVVGGKVYYGFAPREVLERTRVATFGPGKARSRMSAFSFNRDWEQHWRGHGRGE